MRTDSSSVCRAVPVPASLLSLPQKALVFIYRTPRPPSNPFPDPHPSSCPLRRLSGSPSSESKLSQSPGRTMRPAVSEHPGWPGGLGFSQAAGAGGCPGQRWAGGGQSGGAGVVGTPPARPEKTRTGSRQATEAEKGLRAAGGQVGVCAGSVVGQKDFTLAGSPFREPGGGARGPSRKNTRLPLGRFHLIRPTAFSGLLWHHHPLLGCFGPVTPRPS